MLKSHATSKQLITLLSSSITWKEYRIPLNSTKTEKPDKPHFQTHKDYNNNFPRRTNLRIIAHSIKSSDEQTLEQPIKQQIIQALNSNPLLFYCKMSTHRALPTYFTSD